MLAIIAVIASFFMGALGPAQDPCNCLPKNIKRTDVVSAEISRPGRTLAKRVTVEQKLKELKARCRKGKLVDPAGKQIYFYQMQGCWGNPPDDYQEILKRQASDLEKLKLRYRVIEMTCNPDGIQPS